VFYDNQKSSTELASSTKLIKNWQFISGTYLSVVSFIKWRFIIANDREAT